MARAAGRGAADTRRLILGAAAEVLRSKGISASLDAIAEHADVSKGGLKYHFASKDSLLNALATDLLQGFRREVERQRDADDREAGALTRAYARARIAQSRSVSRTREDVVLITLLSTVPSVAALATEDSGRWAREIDDDGLPERISSVVVAAADGVSVASAWGSPYSDDELDRITGYLVDLTRTP